VQSFLRHKDEIEVILDKIALSVAGFTETHVTQELEDHELYIGGYACVRCNSGTSRTGGILLYLKEEIKFDIISSESRDRNWWAITIKVADVNFKGMIMLIYHSPSGSDAAFIKYLEESCESVLLNDSVLVMGDFNIDMKVKDYSQDRFRKTMNSAGLSQLVGEAT